MMEDVDSHLYKPSKPLAAYLNWTFHASFTAVFISFLAIFIVLCLLFAGFLAIAGEIEPDCIVVSGDEYVSLSLLLLLFWIQHEYDLIER